MKEMSKPRIPDEKNFVFTEGLDYSKTGKASIWGEGDKETLELLKKTEIHGRWLNLAAGDWGYTSNLLEKADFVVASDIDESALAKLRRNTQKKYLNKLETRVFDITKRFPYDASEFDGVFCTGTLHLFPTNILRKIFLEIDRVLKPGGKVIIDFATDIKRVSPEGKLITFGKEPLYVLEEGKAILKELFKKYRVKIHESEVPEYLTRSNPPYKFSSKFILLIADKN